MDKPSSGENFVKLKGKLTKSSTKVVGDNSKLFKGVLAIPANFPNNGTQYIKISSFGCAEELDAAGNGSFVEILGHIEEQSYNGKCKHCGGFDKKYWTEVSVDYFKVIY